jgi:hypothetical protein
MAVYIWGGLAFVECPLRGPTRARTRETSRVVRLAVCGRREGKRMRDKLEWICGQMIATDVLSLVVLVLLQMLRTLRKKN